jgi:hypothetical protein
MPTNPSSIAIQLSENPTPQEGLTEEEKGKKEKE